VVIEISVAANAEVTGLSIGKAPNPTSLQSERTVGHLSFATPAMTNEK
jgi:hypothetical protein